jgi:hypothetical protein
MVSSEEKKNRQERFFLDQFLGLQGISPKSVEHREPPDPDFLIDLEGRKVGIELTALHIQKTENNPLKAVESDADKIVSEARRIYFEAGNPLILVTIVFSTRFGLERHRRDHIAKLIADKVQRIRFQPQLVVDWRPCDDENEKRLLSESIAFIHTRSVPEVQMARWSVARAGWAVPLTPKHLQDVIKQKAQKYNGYKKCADEIWLLIYSDRKQPSQMLSIPADFSLDSVSCHPFAKAFYFQYAEGDVIEFSASPEVTARKWSWVNPERTRRG